MKGYFYHFRHEGHKGHKGNQESSLCSLCRKWLLKFQAIAIAGQDGSDAKIYLEKQVNEALAELKKLEDEEAGE